MTDTPHPARSSEFLSRLYDGELAPADREAFATHRAACDECRQAADAFAAALAAFRASPTAPPAADLSARILRKIRAQSPSRRPFGVMFGIDVRWAGVVIAALLVVLISTPLVLRRPDAMAVRPLAIPARILDGPATAKAPSTEVRAAGKTDAAPRAAAPAPAPALASKEEAPAAILAEAPQKPAAREAPADEEKRRYAPAPQAAAQAAPSAARRMTAEPSGGEAASSGATAAEVAERAVRLSVRAFDGEGPAPAVVSHPPDARLAGLRGLEFVLTVEAQGRVRAVQASAGNGFLADTPRSASDAAGVGDVLKELRFAPGDRSRRLLVRVE
ncbi:MAG TPA: hypothetical protein VN032_02865 [Thermoanaerobaculia bacterium]|nr:hypothetical protein [Thermoanaerobaculia bacterium]